jgi:hypothetical protein
MTRTNDTPVINNPDLNNPDLNNPDLNNPDLNNPDLNNITNHGEEGNTATLNSQKLKKTYNRSSSCVKLPSGNLRTRCRNTKKRPFERKWSHERLQA